MAVDPFIALGITSSAPPSMVMQDPSGGDEIPAMKITPPKGGVDPFAALGIDASQPYQTVQQAPKGLGFKANLAAGANKSIFGALGGPVDLTTGAMNLVGRGINAGAGTQIPSIENPVGGSDWLNRQWGNLTGVNPSEVQPTTEAERVAQGAGSAMAQVPLMAMAGAGAAPALSGTARGVAQAVSESGGATLPRAAQIATAAGVGGGVGQAAEDAAPPSLKPYATLLGNLAGAGGVMGMTEGFRAGGQTIARQAGEMGLGSKETIGGQRVTGSQAADAAQQVSQALGPEGRQIIERATEAESEARDLESTLADPATPTVDRTVAQARLNEIQGRRVNLVPNSTPTTAQLAPTAGAVSLEQSHRVAEPAPFNERAQQQNNARVAAIQGIQPEGNPAAVGDLLRQKLNDIDQLGQHTTEAARGQVQQATDALGGTGTQAQFGGEIRGSLSDMNKAAKAREKVLWQAIDPDGNLAMPLGDVQSTARNLMKEVNPRLGDSVSSKESMILSGAAQLPNVVPFGNVQRLWSNIGAAERELRASPGNDQSLRRLGILKSSVGDAIAQAAEGANDPGIAARLNTLGGENGSVAGLGSGQGAIGPAGERVGSGPAEVPRASGNQRDIEGGLSGGQSTGTVAPQTAIAGGRLSDFEKGLYADLAPRPIPAPEKLEPNFDEDAADRYAAAKQATLERKTTYGQGPVGATLRPGQQGAPFRVEEGSVPRQFLTGNAAEPARVQQYINAVGTPEAVTSMRDAMIGDLRDKGVIQSDGTIKGSAFETWLQRRGQTIDQFPGLRDQIGTAQQAQQTLDDVTAAHVGAVKDFQNGAAKNFLNGDEPIVAVRKAFSSGNPTDTFTRLTDLVRGKPDAEAGLRRAVVDFIMEKASTTSPSGASDVDFLKADTFRRWIRENRAPLRVLFGGQGQQNLDMVAADLRRLAQRTSATPGSDTAQKYSSIRKYGLAAAHTGGMSFMALLGEHLGGHFGGGIGGVAGAVGLPYASHLVSSMRQAGIANTNALIREAMLHPDLARTLMERVPAQGIGQLAAQRIAAGLQSAMLADMSAGQRKNN